MQLLSPGQLSKPAREDSPSSAPAENDDPLALKKRWKPWAFLLLSVAALALSLLFSWTFGNVRTEIAGPIIRAVGALGFAFSALMPLWGAGRGILNLRREAPPRFTFENLALVFGYVVLAAPLMFVGFLFAVLSTFSFSRGRQLRRHGRVLLPNVESSGDWTGLIDPLVDGASAPAGLAEQWRENGRTEHASVASFARLTLDLMALGAPPELVRAANEDALDEIRHTEACFALASAIDGKAESPGAFPQAQRAHTLSRWRRLALVELAVLSLIDGALHEGVEACAGSSLESLLPRDAATRISAEVARAAARHAELSAVLGRQEFDLATAERRVAELEASPSPGRALITARLHYENVKRLVALRDRDARALEELADLVQALRTQLVLARFAGSSVEGAGGIVSEVWARVEGLGAAMSADEGEPGIASC